MAKKKEKIELTPTEFKMAVARVAAGLCVEADEHGVDGCMIALVTAMFSAELLKELFNEDKLEVEE